MRVGVFGGTFDPVHYGHLLAAETCREQLNLELIRFIPAAVSPHKTAASVTDGHARADMLKLAVSGYPEFIVDRRELKRSGPSFTVDTLEAMAAESPDDELIFLMGADSLRDFLTWKQPERIAQLATLAVCNRPGVAPISEIQIVEWVGSTIAKSVVSVAIPGTDLSASEIRSRAANGKSLRFRTPRAVEAFIKENHLYGPTTSKN
jgi:nicotinate-nucleotide adenylyltransferase